MGIFTSNDSHHVGDERGPASDSEFDEQSFLANFSQFDDLYAVLGVRHLATQDEIRQAYLVRAKVFHPDMNPSDQVATDAFKMVTEAYKILSNEAERRKYDIWTRQRQTAIATSHRESQLPAILASCLLFLIAGAGLYLWFESDGLTAGPIAEFAASLSRDQNKIVTTSRSVGEISQPLADAPSGRIDFETQFDETPISAPDEAPQVGAQRHSYEEANAARPEEVSSEISTKIVNGESALSTPIADSSLEVDAAALVTAPVGSANLEIMATRPDEEVFESGPQISLSADVDIVPRSRPETKNSNTGALQEGPLPPVSAASSAESGDATSAPGQIETENFVEVPTSKHSIQVVALVDPQIFETEEDKSPLPPGQTPQTAKLVKNIQRKLSHLSCYEGPIDGLWSEASLHAAKTWISDADNRGILAHEPNGALLAALERSKTKCFSHDNTLRRSGAETGEAHDARATPSPPAMQQRPRKNTSAKKTRPAESIGIGGIGF